MRNGVPAAVVFAVLRDRTHHVRWETLPDEETAAAREADLILALQPPFTPESRSSKARSSHASNGSALAIGAYFGGDVGGSVDRLLTEQMADGGWNCEQENGSTRGSFHSTICVLEGLLEHRRAAGGSPEVSAARLGGQEYVLARRLFRRQSTGEAVDPDWLRFSFPTGWPYDVLRGLDYLRGAGVQPDERLAEAAALVASSAMPMAAREPASR